MLLVLHSDHTLMQEHLMLIFFPMKNFYLIFKAASNFQFAKLAGTRVLLIKVLQYILYYVACRIYWKTLNSTGNFLKIQHQKTGQKFR